MKIPFQKLVLCTPIRQVVNCSDIIQINKKSEPDGIPSSSEFKTRNLKVETYFDTNCTPTSCSLKSLRSN